jgi:hypothetical protein
MDTLDQYSFFQYNSANRWLSYYHQIEETLMRLPDGGDVLLIGKGDGVTPEVLKMNGINVTTFDFESDLNPDVQGDVRLIDKYFAEGQFDGVVCFEVLEHISFEFFPGILRSFSSIAGKFVIISLPYNHRNLVKLELKLPRLKPLLIHWDMMARWTSKPISDDHEWEIGMKGFPPKRIRDAILESFSIDKEYRDQRVSYHNFFVLTPRGDS